MNFFSLQKLSSKRIVKIVFYFMLCIMIFPVQNVRSEEFQSQIGESCTIFTVAIGDTVLFGNNEDYLLPNVYRWYIPAQEVTTFDGIKEIYGGVFVGFDNNGDPGDGWEQGGMNEYGLCFDANGLPSTSLNLVPGFSSPYTSHVLAETLWECKNVSDVIQWFENHGWSGYWSGQIHYADALGDAVVVSVNSTGQWTFTQIEDSSYLVSTNFNLANHANGWYPCARYNTATIMLEDLANEEDVTVQACADILYAVHQEGTYATKYSNIFDPVNLDVYFCRGEGYSWQKKFDLEYELNHGQFEEKTTFFGVSGVYGQGVSVKTEIIQDQSYEGDKPVSPWVYIGSGIGGAAVIAGTITTILLIRKKRKISKT